MSEINENKPIRQIRAGDISISIFENEIELKDGSAYKKKEFCSSKKL